MKLFETSRLYVRAFTEGDGAHYWRSSAFAEICFLSESGLHRKSLGRLACFDRVSDDFVAITNLRYLPDLNEFDIGYRVMEEHQGKGLATEICTGITRFAVQQHGVAQPIALVVSDNSASLRVLNKCHYVFETEAYSSCLEKQLLQFRYAG